VIFLSEFGSFSGKKSNSRNRRYGAGLFIFDFDCGLFRSYLDPLKKALTSSTLCSKPFPEKSKKIEISYSDFIFLQSLNKKE
jgi:hypothetical protein